MLLCVYVAQCVWFIHTQSFTVDEPEHIVAGLEAWRYGEYFRWHDQPPLARKLFALPLLNTDWRYELVDQQVQPLQPAPEVWLHRARSVNVLLGVALLVTIWFAARRFFTEGAATFALALAAFSPELIAHASLATTDMAATLFMLVAAVQLLRWRERPDRRQTVLLGAALGLMLVSKFSSPPMFALALLLVLTRGAHVEFNPRRWRWRPAGVICAVAFLIVWATYGFHISRVIFDSGLVTLYFSGYTRALTHQMPTPDHLEVFIPACEYLTGLGMVMVHNAEGHRSFLLGEASATGGWPHYFLVAVLLKWPVLVLALGAAGLWLVLRRRTASENELLLISLFPAVYFGIALFSNINIGVRHVLPVYPFVLLYAAAAWERGRERRLHAVVLSVLVALQAADTLRYAPGHLSYFNVWVPPTRSWEYLSDSNTDWGQSLLALRDYEAAHPDETIHFAYFGLVDPQRYGIRARPLPEGVRVDGTVVVSSTHLSGQLLRDPAAYRWVLAHPRKALLNNTLHVFEVRARDP